MSITLTFSKVNNANIINNYLKYIPNKNYVYKKFRGEKITVLGTQKNPRLRLCMESLCVLVPAKIKQLCSDQTGTANE